MRPMRRKLVPIVAAAVIAPALGACTDFTQLKEAKLLPRTETFTRADWLSFSGAKQDFTLRPVTANDLVGPGGQCPPDPNAAPAAADPSADPSAGQALIAGGIALQMTECDVVRRAGVPDNIEPGPS